MESVKLGDSFDRLPTFSESSGMHSVYKRRTAVLLGEESRARAQPHRRAQTAESAPLPSEACARSARAPGPVRDARSCAVRFISPGARGEVPLVDLVDEAAELAKRCSELVRCGPHAAPAACVRERAEMRRAS